MPAEYRNPTPEPMTDTGADAMTPSEKIKQNLDEVFQSIQEARAIGRVSDDDLFHELFPHFWELEQGLKKVELIKQ
jgi:hypothetical protein